MKALGRFGALALGAILAIAAGQASANTNYGNLTGAQYDFLQVTENATTPGDADPQYGTPVVSGDTLDFPNLTFSASHANGNPFGQDQTSSTLTTTIVATGSETIDFIQISETGNVLASGVVLYGGAFVSAGGSIFVEDTLGGPCVIDLPGEDCQIPFTLVFDQDFFASDGSFAGSVLIDLAAAGYADVTQAVLSVNNNLFAFSEPGASASLEKTSFSIEVIPEPATALLVGGGLIGLSLRARARARRR